MSNRGPNSLFLIIILIFSLALTSCKAQSASPSPEKMRTEIIGAFENQYDFAHRNTNQIKTADQDIQVIIEYAPPDSYLIESEQNFYKKMIVVADIVYGYTNQQWEVLPIDPDQIISTKALEMLKETIKDITYKGQETLDGVQVNVYEYQSDVMIGEAKVTQQNTLYVGISDGLPYKVVMVGQVATMDARTSQIQGIPATTTQIIQYDENINIEPPL
jgi:hypothetical protein